MTKKDYEALAQALAMTKPEIYLGAELGQWRTDVQAIADALQYDNPRFNRAKFLEACDYYE